MKFLLFSDLHYVPGVFPADWSHLRSLQRRAEETGCEMIIPTGDFCHGGEESQDYINAYNNFHIPSYHCLGNHDSDGAPLADTLKRYRMPADHYYCDQCGYRFIVLSTNDYKEGDQYSAYNQRNYYGQPDLNVDPACTLDYVSPEQVAWLEKTIEESDLPCLLFSHQSFERCDGAKNWDKIRKIIDDANKRKKFSVLMCASGHWHVDFARVLNDVLYLDVNAVTYHFLEKPHSCFPEEYRKRYPGMGCAIGYNAPLSAVITLMGSTVRVEGTQSSFYMGVTKTMTGNRWMDNAGREASPDIQSFTITLGH